MSITLVDINLLTSTSSKDKDLVIAIDEPSGGGYVIKSLTKEDLFKIFGHAIDFENSGGNNEVITFDSDEFPSTYNKMVYVKGGSPSNDRFLFKIPAISVSADGSAVAASLNDDGSVQAGTSLLDGSFILYDGGFKTTVQAFDDFTADREVKIFDRDETIDGHPNVENPAMSNGGTTTFEDAAWNVIFMDLSGGSISTYEIDFPTNPKLGDRVTIYALTGGITTLTLDGGGNTVLDPFTGSPNINGGESRTWMYTERGTGFWFPIVA